MPATVITCPDPTLAAGLSVFLAGGITGCPDWQTEAAELLPDWVSVYNPRRPNFPIGDPAAGPEQMEWEAQRLATADAILFWFPRPLRPEVVQPITFYELGRYAAGMHRPAAVGVDLRFSRAADVRHQMLLARGHDFAVWHTLAGTCDEAVRVLTHAGAA